MSNYTQSTNFATKDALTSGDPLKILKGTEINTEYANIAIAVATKADLISPTFVTPALGTPASGTLTNCTGLPVSTGISGLASNVATFLATPSSANLAAVLTDETGTGANVFATSPTLVTPALGTPTSGVMTNVTGLPLSSGVTGTLPVANGGTGVTSSTGSGNNVLSTSPTLTTPALGTPSSGNLANCTFPTLNQSTTGNAATATSATNATTVTTTVSSGAVGTTQANSDNSTKIATTAYVQNMGFGLSQSWQDLTASRAVGTTYTNSTGKPIEILISAVITNSGNGSININSTGAFQVYGGPGGSQTINSVSFTVPIGHTYVLTAVSGTITIISWAELR